VESTTRQTKTVALLGLAFKAHTNDVRQSAAIDVIRSLRTHGIAIKAYDPCAMASMRELFDDVIYCTSAYQAVENVDCIVVLTEWPEFKNLDLSLVASSCKKKKIIDTRNVLDPKAVRACGFEYLPMGAL
jgi:UDPglucose 6-dehydrogenase